MKDASSAERALTRVLEPSPSQSKKREMGVFITKKCLFDTSDSLRQPGEKTGLCQTEGLNENRGSFTARTHPKGVKQLSYAYLTRTKKIVTFRHDETTEI